MKKVYCLYRVSTLGQVEKDDIPMQKQSCQEFIAQHPEWQLYKEQSEKGISGFKVSAAKRDAIQEIQHEAMEGKFDILLVFMFDRLGRRDDETPFVVEWFVRQGVEVWSVKEGQQKFDNHISADVVPSKQYQLICKGHQIEKASNYVHQSSSLRYFPSLVLIQLHLE